MGNSLSLELTPRLCHRSHPSSRPSTQPTALHTATTLPQGNPTLACPYPDAASRPRRQPNADTLAFVAQLKALLMQVTGASDPDVFELFCVVPEAPALPEGAVRVRFQVRLKRGQTEIDPDRVQEELRRQFQDPDSELNLHVEDFLGSGVSVDRNVFGFSVLGAALGLLEDLEWWQVSGWAVPARVHAVVVRTANDGPRLSVHGTSSCLLDSLSSDCGCPKPAL